MSTEGIDWNANIEDLEQDNVEEWEFNLRHSNDKGESDILQGRIDPQLGRIVDELIQESKGRGIPIKTRSDFVRLAIFRTATDLQKYLNSHNEHISHYLLHEKQMMGEAQKSAMLERVLTSVQMLTKGLAVLSSSGREDWNEVNKRITNFLKPALEVYESEPFLGKLYITELFAYSRFAEILESLKSNKKISKTIKEAQKIHES